MKYLASPYSHPDESVREFRFREACRAASVLMRDGNNVFSPIAHTHPIAQFGLPLGWDYWEAFDRFYIGVCDELLVLMLDGWKESKGVQAEISIAKEMNKPVTFLGGWYGEKETGVVGG